LTRAELTKPRLWIATVGLVAILGLSIASAASYLSALESVGRALEVRDTIDEWRSRVRSADNLGATFVATQDPLLRERFGSAMSHQRAAADRLRRLVADNPAQVAAVDAAANDAEVLLAGREELVALLAAGRQDLAAARAFQDERRAAHRRERFEDDCDRLEARETEQLVERRGRARTRVLVTLFAGSTLGLSACGLLILVWGSRARRERALSQATEEARARLRKLSDVAAALSDARSAAEVAEAFVDVGMGALGANVCAMYQANESGDTLELIGSRGVAPELLKVIRTLNDRTGNPAAFETLRSGQMIWAENSQDYQRLFPGLATVATRGPRAQAFWSVPLIVEGRFVGLLAVGFYEPRPFPAEERVLVDTLGRHCAQAMVRARAREREDEARQWLTTTLRSIGDGVIATDATGLVTFMNPVAEDLTGYSEAEAKGRPLEHVFRIISEQQRKPLESPSKKVLREGGATGLATHSVLVARDGHEIPIDDSSAPIRNENDRVVGVVLVFRDVSFEKADRTRREFLSQAGEALVASLDFENTLSTVARLSVPLIADWSSVHISEVGAAEPRRVAVFHADPTKLELVRRMAEEYPPDPDARTGPAEVVRTGRSELYVEVPPTLLEAAAKDAEHLRLLRALNLRSAMVVPLRSRGRTLGAMTFAYAESNRRYSDEDLAFAEDFARRAAMAIENALALRQVEEAREHEHRLRADAEIASRAKDDFLAMVSHELRTPLNAILGWTVMLRSPDSAKNLERGLAVIERNARAQAKLIEDVLDVSRIISGKLALNLGPTSVGEAVTAAVETVTPAALAKDITIETSLPAAPVVITADSQRVQQVVWNLLSNAVKFTPKGGRVRINAKIDGSEVLVEVTDTGEGIRPDALPYVFEPFQQADTSTTRRHGGLGLGLAIVKQLVVAHGGTVSAKSQGSGKGASFLVTLPARAATPAVVAPTRGRSPHGNSEKATGLPRIDGLRVLVVDDEEDALSLVTQVLVAHGAEVHAAGTAREALEKLGSVHPDVIVSDIGMPEEDGYALIRKIRALPSESGGGTPAVALTAYAREDDARRAFAAGYQIHVAKPVEPTQLATVVANLGGRSLQAS
jgi:PAS domain S-box-containing protein